MARFCLAATRGGGRVRVTCRSWPAHAHAQSGGCRAGPAVAEEEGAGPGSCQRARAAMEPARVSRRPSPPPPRAGPALRGQVSACGRWVRPAPARRGRRSWHGRGAERWRPRGTRPPAGSSRCSGAWGRAAGVGLRGPSGSSPIRGSRRHVSDVWAVPCASGGVFLARSACAPGPWGAGRGLLPRGPVAGGVTFVPSERLPVTCPGCVAAAPAFPWLCRGSGAPPSPALPVGVSQSALPWAGWLRFGLHGARGKPPLKALFYFCFFF